MTEKKNFSDKSQIFGKAAPWYTFGREIEALFRDDPDVNVEVNDYCWDIKLYVDNAEKAEALTQIMPTKKMFGNITVTISVIPANLNNESKIDLFQKAFKGNPVLSYICPSTTSFAANYVVFQNKVVQFFDDNLGDVNGNTSTLYEDIARDVFEDCDGIFFCTDKPKTEFKF